MARQEEQRRHVRPTELVACLVSFPLYHPALDGVFVLVPRKVDREGGHGHNGDVSFRVFLFTRHGSCAVRLFRRSLPFTHPRNRHEFRDGDDVVFNFILSFTWPSLVSAFRSQGAFDWVSCMVHRWPDRRAAFFAGDEGFDAGGFGSGF